LLARGKIQDRKSVEVGQLHEDSLGRAVRTRLDRHRANALVELDLTGGLLGREIDNRYDSGSDRTGDDVFAVRGHVHIMQPSANRDAFGPGQSFRIDDIKWAGIAGTAEHAEAIL